MLMADMSSAARMVTLRPLVSGALTPLFPNPPALDIRHWMLLLCTLIPTHFPPL